MGSRLNASSAGGLFLSVLLFSGMIQSARANGHVPKYQFEVLERPEGMFISDVHRINAVGEVLGDSGGSKSILWRGTNAVRIMASRQVMNEVGMFAGAVHRGSWWQDIETPWYEAEVEGETVVPIPSFGGPRMFPLDINNKGEVVGGGNNSSGQLAFLWKNGQRTDLNELVSLSTNLTFGHVITDDGIIYASTYLYGGGARMFKLTPTAMGRYSAEHLFDFFLGGHQIMNKQGYGISMRTFWDGTEMRDLGDLGIPSRVYAKSVNSHKEVVGYAQPVDDESYHGFYWNGQMEDINTLVNAPGWNIYAPESINDYGQVAGMAYNGQAHYAVRLTPYPCVISATAVDGVWRIEVAPGARKGIVVETSSDFSEWHEVAEVEQAEARESFDIPLSNSARFFRVLRR